MLVSSSDEDDSHRDYSPDDDAWDSHGRFVHTAETPGGSMPTYRGRGVHRYVLGEPALHDCTGPESEAHHLNVASGL
eukprot:3308122-Rhodomonas_salina.1